jgi:hypothetical protein
MKASQQLIDFVEDLRGEVKEVRKTAYKENSGRGREVVSQGALNGLVAGCRLLIVKLGPFGGVWDAMLRVPLSAHISSLEKISGVLDTIAESFRKGRLSTLEEVISADFWATSSGMQTRYLQPSTIWLPP